MIPCGALFFSVIDLILWIWCDVVVGYSLCWYIAAGGYPVVQPEKSSATPADTSREQPSSVKSFVQSAAAKVRDRCSVLDEKSDQ